MVGCINNTKRNNKNSVPAIQTASGISFPVEAMPSMKHGGCKGHKAPTITLLSEKASCATVSKAAFEVLTRSGRARYDVHVNRAERAVLIKPSVDGQFAFPTTKSNGMTSSALKRALNDAGYGYGCVFTPDVDGDMLIIHPGCLL